MTDAVSVVIPTRDRSPIVVDTVPHDARPAPRRGRGHRRRRRFARRHGPGSRGGSATRASPCCSNASSRGVARARNRGIERAAHPWVAFLDDDDRWSPEKLRVQLDRARAEDADFVYTAGLAVSAGDGRVLYASPAFTPEEMRRSIPQPQPRLRGLVERPRARPTPAATRRLRRVAAPHRGLGHVDSPDRGGAAAPRARSHSWRMSCTRRTCTGPRSTAPLGRAASCGPSMRTAACRAGSIPSSSGDGSPTGRPIRGDPGAPPSPSRSLPCATAAGPTCVTRWAAALRAVGSAPRRAPRVSTARRRTGYRIRP